MKILLIEDEVKLAGFIKTGLQQSGHFVDLSHHGNEGLEQAMINQYDLILLDLMLPGQNGFDILRNLKEFNNPTPVIVVSALSDSEKIIRALDEGAWDYIKKPFDFDELLARIRILQRKLSPALSQTVIIGQLEFDIHKRDATVKGKRVLLTNRQFGLLELLWNNADKIVTKHSIAEKVWERDFDMSSNIIEVTIHQLRKKIDPDNTLIETVIGRGYVLNSHGKE